MKKNLVFLLVLAFFLLGFSCSSNYEESPDPVEPVEAEKTIKTEDDRSFYEESSSNEFNNLSGNIVNNSFIAKEGEWIYYSNIDDGYKLYKKSIDGSEKIMINEDRPSHINVVGEWIYYSNFHDNNSIYKAKTDGTERIKLNDNKSSFINISGNWLYYINGDDLNQLYKMKTDGTEHSIISEEYTYASKAVIVNDWIYYTRQYIDSSGIRIRWHLYKIRLDGTENIQLNEDNTGYFDVSDEWIYYTNESDKGSLYKIKTDGSEREKINDEKSYYINLHDDWIFYHNDKLLYESQLCKVNIDGSERKVIDKDKEYRLYINIINDWIYYIVGDAVEDELYRIRVDGTNKQVVY